MGTDNTYCRNLWKECLKIFRDNVSELQFNAWFKPIVPVGFDGTRLDIHVPSSFFMEYLEANFINLIRATIQKIYGRQVVLFYHYNVVGNESETDISIKTENSVDSLKPAAKTRQDAEHDVRNEELDSQLNPRYNFSNYFPGSSNKLARSIGVAIASDPKSKTFNPFFIFGPSGVGKTHLLHAIGIAVKENSPSKRVLYVTSRLFESQFITATMTGKHNEFIQFYQSIDCLLIDDIQDLIGKEKTQNAFFHIFSHLQLNQKQIILSSDCAPANMSGLPERLTSRFKWGITAELERPDYALRLSVLKQKAEQEGLKLSDEILEYIALNVTESIREIEGVMVSLLARATFLNQEISVELIDSIIENFNLKKNKVLNFEIITQQVSKHFNIEPDQLFTKTRKREISDARQMVMYMAKKHIDMPLTAIGTRLSRTHATVIHACRNIEERLTVDKQLQEDIEAIEKSLL